MSDFTPGSAPGMHTQSEGEATQVWWSGRHGQNLVATRKVTVDSASVDAGNTPTTTLRGGNLLAIETASGKAAPYAADANDGTQIAQGVLEHSQSMLQDGAAADRHTQMLVHGLLKEGEVVGLDPRAKQQLAGRFVFDCDLAASAGELMHPRGVYRKGLDYTVTAADNGLLFVATAVIEFTLPTKQNGLAFRFLQTSDANLTILGSSDIVHKGNVAASSVAFSTSGQKIGSQALVECMYIGEGSLKWVVPPEWWTQRDM